MSNKDKQTENRKPSAGLMEAKKKAREAGAKKALSLAVKDIYQNVYFYLCTLLEV